MDLFGAAAEIANDLIKNGQALAGSHPERSAADSGLRGISLESLSGRQRHRRS